MVVVHLVAMVVATVMAVVMTTAINKTIILTMAMMTVMMMTTIKQITNKIAGFLVIQVANRLFKMHVLLLRKQTVLLWGAAQNMMKVID